MPALEAIESVGVTTSTFDADQGLSGGMSANVLIKSGTNSVRGSAFEYLYNEGLKSRPYFLPATEEKPEASQHQFGGTLGGPIVRNKAFFFGAIRAPSIARSPTRFGTVPTAAMRNGDFSASPTPIYDPADGRRQRQRPDGVLRQHHPARTVRSDRAEAHRGPAAAEPPGPCRQLLRHGELTRSIATTSTPR